jgi:soluble lytic murein transglycosylase-like protein
VTAADCSGRLLDPSFNLAVGQKYVRHLAGQPIIGDNLMLLLAAYNEGPGKLARGLHDGGAKKARGHHAEPGRSAFEKEDPLFFLESLSLRQTHDYIEQVLIHYWIYRARLGEPENSLTDLAHGAWPRIAPPEEAKPLPKGTKEAALPDMLPAGIVKVASVR